MIRMASGSSRMSTGGTQDAPALSRYCQSRSPNTSLKRRPIRRSSVFPTSAGPHNVTGSPDGRYWYVTIAHGTPYGTLWKMAVDGDTLVGKAPVEMFPTTISLTPDGELAFVANSEFHGDHPRMNVVSIVYT